MTQSMKDARADAETLRLYLAVWGWRDKKHADVLLDVMEADCSWSMYVSDTRRHVRAAFRAVPELRG